MQISKNTILKTGIISKNEKWSGNIIIKNNLVIPEGVSVVVLPGTKIKFISEKNEINPLIENRLKFICDNFPLDCDKYISQSSIIVKGNFYVLGIIDNRINIGNCGWNGFIFVDKLGKIIIEYADIRYGFGIIFNDKSKLSKISNCLIEQCCIGISSFSKLIIKKSNIRYNDIGVSLFNKSILISNNINDNLFYGIYIQSEKTYVLKNNISLNPIAILILNSSNIKTKGNNINNNIVAITIRNSRNSLLDNFVNHNDYSISVEDYSSNILVFGVLIKSKFGVIAKKCSSVRIEEAKIVLVEKGVFASDCSQIEIVRSDFIKSIFNFVAINSSAINIIKSNCRSEHLNLLSQDEADINIENTLLDTNNQNIVSLGNYSKIYVYNSKLQTKNIICILELYSEICLNSINLSGNKFIHLSDSSNLYLKHSVVNLQDDIICALGSNNIYILESDIKSNKGRIVLLNNDSKLKLESSKVYSKLQFCKLRDNSCVDIVNSNIISDNSLAELQEESNINIYNTKLLNKYDFLFKIKNNSKIEIDRCDISLKKYFNKQQDRAYFICSNSNINGNMVSVLEKYNSFYLHNNIINIEDFNIETFHFSKVFITDNKFYTKNFEIKLNYKDESVLKNNELYIKDLLKIDINYSLLLFYETKINSKVFNIKSINSSIDICNSKISANIYFDFEMTKVLFNRCCLNSLDTKKFFVFKNSKLKLNDSVFSNLQINLLDDSKIYIKDSEMKGKIEADGIGDIDTSASNIGDLLVRGMSHVVLRDSEIEGKKVEVINEGNVDMYNCDMNLDEGIEIESEIGINIESSKIVSKSSCIKIKNGEIKLRDSEIEGDKGIEIGELAEIKIEGIKIKSKEVGMIYRGEREKIEIEGVKIDSESKVIEINDCSKIYIKDSEMKGKIEADGIGDIDISASNIGDLLVKDTSHVVLRGSEIKGEKIEAIDEGYINIYDCDMNLDEGIEIESEIGINIESSKIVSKSSCIKIKNGEIKLRDSEIEGDKGIEIGELAEIKIEGIKIKSKEVGMIYRGEREKIEIEGVKIDSESKVIEINDCSKIYIKDSEIKGKIEADGIGDIDISASNIGDLLVKDMSHVVLRDSGIEGKKVEVINEGHFDMYNCEINLDEGIEIEGNGKACFDSILMNFNNNGILKSGFESLILNNTCLNAQYDVLKSSGISDIYLSNMSVTSKNNYSLDILNSNLFINNLRCSGNQGISAIDSKLKIKNLKMDIFGNAFKFINSEVLIDDFKINSKFYQKNISISNTSKVVLNNGKFNFDNKFNFNKAPIFIISEQSDISMSNILLETKNNVDTTVFLFKENIVSNLNNVTIKNFYNLAQCYINSSLSIYNSNISTIKESIILHNNSVVNIYNTKFESDEPKFVLNDFSNIILINSYVYNGSFAIADKFSEAYTQKLLFNCNKIIRLSDYSIMNDKYSTWNIQSYNYDNKNAVCYLMNCSSLNIQKSDIDTNTQFVFAINKSKIDIRESSVKSETKFPLFDFRYFSSLNMLNTVVDAPYIFQLKDMSQINIDGSKFNIKDLFAYSLDDCKIFIINTTIKTIEKTQTAIKVLYNSKLNLKNSKILGFINAIKYDTFDNIKIFETKIKCNNKLIKNDLKSRNVLLNLIQKFVLSTRNIFGLKHIYKLIYFISIKLYVFLINKKCINSLYLRRGMLNDWIPGSSDIDYLTIVNNESNLNEIYNLNNRYKILKKIFPFYGENLIMTIKELNFYLLYGGVRSKNLLEAKILYGKNIIEKKDINLIFIKNKIDIVSEILNSYILFSNAYFFDDNITNDICFSKASIDILKYIDYFYTDNKPISSRLSFIKIYLQNCDSLEKQYLSKIIRVLVNNKNFSKNIKDKIFNIIFIKLNKLAEDFINFIKNNIELHAFIKIPEKIEHSLFSENLTKLDISQIKSVLFEDPGLCYVTLDNINNVEWSDLCMYYNKYIKNISIIHNTPMLFFTDNMFQMMLLSKFKNTPINILKLNNFKNKYKSRIFYLKNTTNYYCYKQEILNVLIFESISELSFKLNDIEMLKDFNEICKELYSYFVQILEFYLYMKNGKMSNTKNSDDIILQYSRIGLNNKKEIEDILLCFSEYSLLSDYDKKIKILTFIKNLKDKIINKYG